MSGPDPAGTGPGDCAEVALAELVARYVALRLDQDPDPGVGADPAEDRAGRALQQLALGTAIAGRVQAGWALDAVAALRAGASCDQVAAARGQAVPAVRAELAGWLRGQARLHRDTVLGLDPGEAAQAWRLFHAPRSAARRTTDKSRGLDGPDL
ncbi:MAG TPA: hypothetical protein VFV66_05655 [Nonomuraea sp.]|nr:hypothetical protein [Nonomuraea sp.]